MYSGWAEPDEIPRFAIVGTAPQCPGPRINNVGPQRVEGEELNRAAQVEHAPGAGCVMTDIGSRHVTGHEHFAGIVRVDSGVEHGSPAARADYFEFAGATRLGHHAERERAPRHDCVKLFHRAPD